jgi:hypothetical protein
MHWSPDRESMPLPLLLWSSAGIRNALAPSELASMIDCAAALASK